MSSTVPDMWFRGIGRTAVLVWLLGRGPALILAVYFLRSPVLAAVETHFDIVAVTSAVIDILSTPMARTIWGITFGAVLLLAVAIARRFRALAAYMIVLLTAGTLVALVHHGGAISARRGGLVWLIVAANFVPRSLLAGLQRYSRTWNALMIAGVGIVELFFAREYWRWLRGQAGSTRPPGHSQLLASVLPGLLLGSIAFALLIHSEDLLIVEQRVRLSPDAVILERGQSFNWLELDPSGRYLYATGHTMAHLRRYDLLNPSARPLQSQVSTGGAQGFAYDPTANEIYAINTYTKQLVYFDAPTLEQRHIVDVPRLSPGDPWVAVDGRTGTITLVSEADSQVGAPLIVLERSTGRVLGEAPLDAGNILKHPSKPWLYLSFFRRRKEVLLYDLETRSIRHSTGADPQAERMVYWQAGNELLVTSPVKSRIMRFDADNLNPKGYFPAPFGARAIALDEQRQLLLCGNIATGYVVTIDLRSGTPVQRHYLGPWLRTIALQVESGTAYVSSNGALYRLKYAPRLRQSSARRERQLVPQESTGE
jgi:hypothetical protein